MSQFSQKYYKHYFIDKKDKKDIKPKKDNLYTMFWYLKEYKILEFFIIALLLLILFCLCLEQRQKTLHTKEVVTVIKEVPIIQQCIKDNNSSIKRKKENITYSKENNTYKYKKEVLPDISKLSNQDGHVTIEQYLYFANDIHGEYPNFINPNTLTLIKEKAPKCYKPQCPLTGVTDKQLQKYEKWLQGFKKN